MKNYSLLLFSLLLISLFSCKKEDDELTSYSNLFLAPSVVNQEFEIEIILDADRVYEKRIKSANAEFSRATFKYEGDTIIETVYELQKKAMERKHAVVNNLIVATIDSVYGTDTIQYYRQIIYEYSGNQMIRMVVEQFNVLADKTIDYSSYEHDYTFENQNLTSIVYESSNTNDPLSCADRFEYYTYEADVDVHNLIGISQSSKSKNLKSKINQLTDCNGNGPLGSTQYEYWYNINTNRRVTELVYTKTFNGSVTSFRETYRYTPR